MAPFELLLLSAFVASSASLPTSILSSYRGAAGQWDVHQVTAGPHFGQHTTAHTASSAISGYQCFDGDSSSSIDAKNWLSFGQLWALNEPTILSKNGGDTYLTHYIREAIVKVSCDSAMNAGLVLAIMMQESAGRASIPCKAQAHGGSRCGLMQATGGSTLDLANPQASIHRMIKEGVEGDGLDQALDGDVRYLNDVANRLLGWNGKGHGFESCE